MFLCLSTWEVSVDISSGSLLLSSAMSVLRRSHQRHSSFLCFWFQVFPFVSFLAYLFLCLCSPICYCMLSTISVKDLNILLIVILTSLIFPKSLSESDLMLVWYSSDTCFPLPFGVLCNFFFLKSRYDILENRNGVVRLSVWHFMLMWLELIYVQCLLYLYMPETLVSFSFFLFCFAFFPFSWSFPKNIFIKRVCVSCNPLGCNPLLLCWNPVDVFLRCHGWVLFYNVVIKSQFFSGLLSVVCGLQDCFSASLYPPLKWDRKARRGCSWLVALPSSSDKALVKCLPFKARFLLCTMSWVYFKIVTFLLNVFPNGYFTPILHPYFLASLKERIFHWSSLREPGWVPVSKTHECVGSPLRLGP